MATQPLEKEPKKLDVLTKTKVNPKVMAGVIVLVGLIGLSFIGASLLNPGVVGTNTDDPKSKPVTTCKSIAPEDASNMGEVCAQIAVCEQEDGTCKSEYKSCANIIGSTCGKLGGNVSPCWTIMECLGDFFKAYNFWETGTCVHDFHVLSPLVDAHLNKYSCISQTRPYFWCETPAPPYIAITCNCTEGGARFLDPTIRPLFEQYQDREALVDCLLSGDTECGQNIIFLMALGCINTPCHLPSAPGATGQQTADGVDLYSGEVGGTTITGTQEFVEKALKLLDSMAINGDNCEPLPDGCRVQNSFGNWGNNHSVGKAIDFCCDGSDSTNSGDCLNPKIDELINSIQSQGSGFTIIRECTKEERGGPDDAQHCPSPNDTSSCSGGLVHIDINHNPPFVQKDCNSVPF